MITCADGHEEILYYQGYWDRAEGSCPLCRMIVELEEKQREIDKLDSLLAADLRD